MINLITPPDKLYNDNKSILLLYPSDQIKNAINELLIEEDIDVNLYLYTETEPHDIDWILNRVNICDICIFDLDNIPSELRGFDAYFISKPNTYWLTNGDYLYYNSINNNRIFDLDVLKAKIGAKLEKQQTT